MNLTIASRTVVLVAVLTQGLINSCLMWAAPMQTAVNIAIVPKAADLHQEGSGAGPVLVEDHFMETMLGNADGVDVSVVDVTGFDPGTHGQRITDIFLAETSHASLVQIEGWGEYRLNGMIIRGINARGYIRHALKHGAGIFWTATGQSPEYSPATASQWFMENNRVFLTEAREFATWMQNRNTLFIASMENTTAAGPPPSVAVYCDDFDGEGGWIPPCGAISDYVAHSGVGLANTVFVGAIETRFGTAQAAIRADGVFAPHTIYVESPDGSTSQATPVLAAYATDLAYSNPSWGAARLKQELLKLASEEVIDYRAGGVDSRGVSILERRTIKAIRPEGRPSRPESPPIQEPSDPKGYQYALDFAHFANGASITSDLVLLNVAPHPIRPAFYFYDQEGSRIAAESVVDVTGDLTVAEDGALTVRAEIEPLGELTISTHGRGETVSGSVRVVSSGSIGGVLRFDIPEIAVAGVGAGQPVRDALFPARRQVGGIRTAAAIRNLEAEAMVVTCRLMKGGAVLEEADISLEADGQSARFIEEVFTVTDTSDFAGSVRCTAEGRFTGVAIEMDAGNRIITTLPVVPVER